MKAKVSVTLKTGVLDPQGKAIEGALRSLGIEGVSSVRQGKLFEIELGGDDRAEAERALRRACERLLANTVVENYAVEIVEGPEPRPAPEPVAVTEEGAMEEAARAVDMPAEGHP